MVDFMNPSEDLLAGLWAGRNEQQDEIDRLTAENKRLRIECEAWRSGRLLLLMDTNPDPARPLYTPMFAVGDMAGSPFDTITAAVDALMAEEGE